MLASQMKLKDWMSEHLSQKYNNNHVKVDGFAFAKQYVANWRETVTEVTPFLYLTGFTGVTPENLSRVGATMVLNVLDEDVPYTSDIPVIIAVKNLRMPKMSLRNFQENLSAGADAIEEERMRGGITVVHCWHGISRSSSVVLAYLIRHQQMTLVDAFEYLASKRVLMLPNWKFFQQLMHFEQATLHTSSITLANGINKALPKSYNEAEIPVIIADHMENILNNFYASVSI